MPMTVPGHSDTEGSATRTPEADPPTRIALRPFHRNDQPAVEEIFLLARRQAFPWMPPESFRRGDLTKATADELIWIGESENRIAGFISIWVPGSFIHNLFVHPDSQGCGVGTALIDQAAELVPMPLTLKCKVRNRRACRFYEHRGWQPVRKEKDRDGSYWLYQLDRPGR